MNINYMYISDEDGVKEQYLTDKQAGKKFKEKIEKELQHLKERIDGENAHVFIFADRRKIEVYEASKDPSEEIIKTLSHVDLDLWWNLNDW